MDIPQIKEQILILDSSVPITFACTAVRVQCREDITGLENAFDLCSSTAAHLKSVDFNDLMAHL